MLIDWLAAAGAIGLLTAATARYLRSEARLEGAAAKLPLTPMRQVVDGARARSMTGAGAPAAAARP